LSPCPSFDPGHDPNDNSLVLRVDFAGRSLLFAGDIEGHAEEKLVGQGAPLRADVLKVPHHGSRTSSSERLLHAVQPQLAVISAGAWNPFAHPHPEVRARLRRHARRVVELAEHGGAVLSISAAGKITLSHGPGSSDELQL
jgi:competence protein ComEC